MSSPGQPPEPEPEPEPEPPDTPPTPHGITPRVDVERCIGSGNCSYWAPTAFELADEGYAVVLEPEAEAVDEERLRVAAQGCPVGAISLWRDGRRLDEGDA